jgi:hypothetical protein
MQEEQELRRRTNDPLLKAPISSELGNITPAFIVPAFWTKEELEAKAALIVMGMADNAGCNCLSTKTVVMAAEWPQVC